MKALLFSGIRSVHRAVALGPLPDRLAIYFHDLEAPHWPAFQAAIEWLKAADYKPVDPLAFVNGSHECKRLFISFDDSFASWHRALPLFGALGIKATFYVNTLPFDAAFGTERDRYFDRLAHKGERQALSAEMLRDIHSDGHTIGCHSHSHFSLASLPRAQWDSEIKRSKDILEDLTGAPIVHFSFPYGMRRFFSSALRDYCRDIGFETIATGIPGMQTADTGDRFAIHRTGWLLDRPIDHNLDDLRIDGRLFERVTGRSAIG